MKRIKIRDLTIGEGRPKICAPIVGSTKEEIFMQAEKCRISNAELVEWRADWFESVFRPEEVLDVLKTLREVLGNIPILFTFRTKEEGGMCSIEKEQYRTLNLEVIKSGWADLIDVEIFFDEAVAGELIEAAHEHHKKVIASNHDFQGTPKKEEIIRRLCYMQECQADLLKIAVMPCKRQDVLTLLSATEEMEREYADRPIITMSMGEMGIISRISGELFGSALTFASVEKASAPGQMEMKELKKILDILHEKL